MDTSDSQTLTHNRGPCSDMSLKDVMLEYTIQYVVTVRLE